MNDASLPNMKKERSSTLLSRGRERKPRTVEVPVAGGTTIVGGKTELAEVKPGQIWKWKTPDGSYRTMLVQRIQPGPGVPRACGVHPQTHKRLQVHLSVLRRGMHDAELVSVIEGYVYERRGYAR